MRKFYKALFLLLIIVSLFSCPNKPADSIIVPVKTQHTVKFYIWDKQQNNYIERIQTVDDGTKFGSITKPKTPMFDKDDLNYSFADWVENFTPSDVSNSIIVNGVKVDDNAEINTNKIYYAKYNSSIIPIKQNIIINFNVWDKQKNKYIESSQTVEKGKTFGSITKPETPIFDRNSSTYTFLGWVEKTDFINDSDILTEGEVVNNNIQISANKSYYAKYTSADCCKVIFKIYDKVLSKYAISNTLNVVKGTIFSSITKPEIHSFVNDGNKYTSVGWVKSDESTTPITEGTEVLDILTVKENETYYAKYTSEEILHTIKLYVWDNNQNTYIESSKTVKEGTKFSSITKPDTPSIDKDGMTYTFIGWVDTTKTFSEILTEGEIVNNNIKISSSKSYYAKYTSADCCKVIFKIYNKNLSIYSIIDSLNVEKGTIFDDIINKNFSTDSVVIGGTKYSFYGWTDIKASSSILENYNHTKVDENTQITSDKTFCALYKGDYLCFEAVEKTTVQFDFIAHWTCSYDVEVVLQYRKESDRNFKDYKLGSEIYLSEGDKVYFKGNNSKISHSTNSSSVRDQYHYLQFKSSGIVEASGSVMSITSDYYNSCLFYRLFSDCSQLLTAPELPATRLAWYCYLEMFSGCTSLTEAPELPATTLANNCYSGMFKNCKSLTEAPELPATILEFCCYSSMFAGCTSLTKAPELPAIMLDSSCYKYMFANCSSLVKAPTLPATTLFWDCYSGMFSGCTLLTEAPKLLPATILSRACYQMMFSGCTSLVEAPELSATTLADLCCDGMFYGCTSLVEAPELLATTLAESCYREMFYGCTSLTSITCLATDISAFTRTSKWVDGVSSSGTFYCKEGVNWTKDSSSGIPKGWTVEYV